MSRQLRLDGSFVPVDRNDRVASFRTDREGYETWRRQWRESGDKREETVRVHRLAAVAWFGPESVEHDRVVHHNNRVPWDNREANLTPMTRADHSELHNDAQANGPDDQDVTEHD